MNVLVVVSKPADWPLEMPGVEVVSTRQYLTDPAFARTRGTKVFNLAKSYRYQSLGYYVSLLAAARGHRPLPSASAIQEMKSITIARIVSEDIQGLIDKDLNSLKSSEFTLSIYFGRNVAKKHDKLARYLFNEFEAPLLRAFFQREAEHWVLAHVSPIPASEIPEGHREFVLEAAREFFTTRRHAAHKKQKARFNVAILHDPDERESPSNARALDKFVKAGESLDLDVDLIEKDDYGRVAEFDALFIRETTAVNHHTFRFSQRAAAEGLVVIDDPESILRCTNKVFLTEALGRLKLPTPKTLVVHKDNLSTVGEALGFPCILKQPDSAFSQGVLKVRDQGELDAACDKLLERSELVIAQAWLPTTFDWRIGVFAGEALFACKYFMAPKHWQIIQRDGAGKPNYGRSETIPVELAPRKLVRLAEKAAAAMGDGLYGVDIKEADGQYFVIEVNDNPNIDAGVEDATLKDKLYLTIMRGFLERIERVKAALR